MEFRNEKTLNKFMNWMCNHGEEEYWSSMEEETGEDIVEEFQYDLKEKKITCT
jgi:hypothetical protein